MSGEHGSGIEVVMPQFSESMEAGTIISWLVKEGQIVAAGDELAEIENG